MLGPRDGPVGPSAGEVRLAIVEDLATFPRVLDGHRLPVLQPRLTSPRYGASPPMSARMIGIRPLQSEPKMHQAARHISVQSLPATPYFERSVRS